MDSNGDGVKDNDKDFLCNTPAFLSYEPSYQSTKWRITYTNDLNQQVTKDFTVSFLDYQANLSPELKVVASQLDTLIASFARQNTWIIGNFVTLLTQLRDGLVDTTATKSNLVAVREYQQTNSIQLDANQTSLMNAVYLALSDKSVAAAEGGTEYDTAKAEILASLPSSLAPDIQALFENFESVVSDTTTSQQDKRKAALQNILDVIQKHVAAAGETPTDTQIDSADMEATIIPNMCTIMKFYSIASQLCPSNEVKTVDQTVTAENTGGTSVLKIVLWRYCISFCCCSRSLCI